MNPLPFVVIITIAIVVIMTPGALAAIIQAVGILAIACMCIVLLGCLWLISAYRSSRGQ
jgi:hypothetical protein